MVWWISAVVESDAPSETSRHAAPMAHGQWWQSDACRRGTASKGGSNAQRMSDRGLHVKGDIRRVVPPTEVTSNTESGEWLHLFSSLLSPALSIISPVVVHRTGPRGCRCHRHILRAHNTRLASRRRVTALRPPFQRPHSSSLRLAGLHERCRPLALYTALAHHDSLLLCAKRRPSESSIAVLHAFALHSTMSFLLTTNAQAALLSLASPLPGHWACSRIIIRR